MPNDRPKKQGFLGFMGGGAKPLAQQIGGNYPGQAQSMLNSGSTPQDVIGAIMGRRTGNINLPGPTSITQAAPPSMPGPMNTTSPIIPHQINTQASMPGPMNNSMPTGIAAPSPGIMNQIRSMNPFAQFGQKIDQARKPIRRNPNVR